MGKFDAKLEADIDVLVLGEHPCAYLAAALLRQDVGKPVKGKPKLRVVHAVLPSEQAVDRLVTVNPALFDLHPLMGRVHRDPLMTPIYGLQFLADDAATASEHRSMSAMVGVVRYRHLRDAVAAVAAAEGVEFIVGGGGGEPPVRVHRADETGLDVTVGKHALRPTALIMAADRPRDHVDPQAALGLPDSWGADVVHRFTSLRCKSVKHLTLPDPPLMPMSLDLAGRLCWAWLMPGDGEFQLTVEQPLDAGPMMAGGDLLAHWVTVLQRHGHLGSKFTFDRSAITSVDLPLAGALVHEGVANRTLLIGPAGGFYSACGEDVYPGCWSAVFAADVLRKALRQPHLQDALADYRQVWRTTLGDYLRGPQQNLRLLLPLVYRNPVMTARLAEAILLSKSVVR